MGSQFIRIETYSRKADAKGRTVGFVLDEVERRPEASQHVAQPGEPRVVFGSSVAELRALHDELVDGARNTDATGKARKVRVDQHTMLTAVASHSATSAAVRYDPEKAAAVDDWQQRTVAWMRERWGDRLVSVVRHDDESHPHLHAYVLPEAPAMKARAMHPGLVAKEAEKAVAVAEGATGKEANARGDRAYKQAMREFQDAYWQGVGLPSGMTRIGPGRRRLTRDAWHAERSQVEHAAVAIAEAERARGTAAGLRERGAVFVARARQAHATATEAAEAAKAAADAADNRRAEAERAERVARQRAAGLVKGARKEAAGIVGEARQQADRLRQVGSVLGSIWTGFSGVRRRLEDAAERRVAEARQKGQEGVQGALAAARVEVGGELSAVRQAALEASRRAEAAERQAKAAETARTAAERQAAVERQKREQAEREREDFRGRWAVADNRLQAQDRRHGR